MLEPYLKQLISRQGPLSVAAYMGLCLGHPEYGYYQTRDPLGQGGDFTTAPEISQMFGEIIGAWLAAVWESLGNPQCQLVELGPGRGTLLADIMRVAGLASGFREAVSLHLIETSPVLREAQAGRLAGYAPDWYESIEELPEAPALFVMNEFFDALPIRQFVSVGGKLVERCVMLNEADELCFGLDERRQLPGEIPPGGVVETCPSAIAIMGEIGRRVASLGGAGLVIDYGYAGPAVGDTLQALSQHEFVDPLQRPGEVDLTAHVDFTALATAARRHGAEALPLQEQGSFLRQLGIEARTAQLAIKGGEAVQAALARLIAPDQMGSLFKVLGVAGPGQSLPGFRR